MRFEVKLCFVSILPELSNFEDEILFEEGRNVTSGFSNSESRTQDNTPEFYYTNFTNLIVKIIRFKLY